MSISIADWSHYIHPIILAFITEACDVNYSVQTWKNFRQIGGLGILHSLKGRSSCLIRPSHWRSTPIRLWIVDTCPFTSRHRLDVCLLQLDRSSWKKQVPTIMGGKVRHHIIPSVGFFFVAPGRGLIYDRLLCKCCLLVFTRQIVQFLVD